MEESAQLVLAKMENWSRNEMSLWLECAISIFFHIVENVRINLYGAVCISTVGTIVFNLNGSKFQGIMSSVFSETGAYKRSATANPQKNMK